MWQKRHTVMTCVVFLSSGLAPHHSYVHQFLSAAPDCSRSYPVLLRSPDFVYFYIRRRNQTVHVKKKKKQSCKKYEGQTFLKTKISVRTGLVGRQTTAATKCVKRKKERKRGHD